MKIMSKDLMRILDLFNSKYKCVICRKRLRYKADEIIHSEIIHNQNNMNNSCPFCGKLFRSSFILRKHLMNIHLNEKPYKCRICGKKFSQFFNLKKHCKKHLSKKIPLNRMIAYENSRFQIISDKKKNFKEYFIITGHNVKKCNECSFKFIYDSEYLIHIWNQHMKSNFLICWQCGYRFSSAKCLLLHLGEHLDEKIFKCSLCTKEQSTFFSTFEKAKDHYLKYHLKPKIEPSFKLICYICDEVINESKILNHYKKCSPTLATKFSCTDCNFTFDNQHLFELHKVQHRYLKEQKIHLNKSYLMNSLVSQNHSNKSVNSSKIDDIALKILTMKQKKIDFEREEALVQYSPFLIQPSEKYSLNTNNTIKIPTARFNFPINVTQFMFERQFLDDQLLKKENLRKFSFSYLNQVNSVNQCELCGFSFRSIFELNSHKYSHLTANNKRPFRCHLCLVTFSKIDQLKRHMIVHQVKEQDSVCQICFSSFSRKQDLDRHLLFHSKK